MNYESRQHDRRSRFVDVTHRDHDEYRHAVGKRKVELHMRLFYGPNTVDLTSNVCSLEHPILVGEMYVGAA